MSSRRTCSAPWAVEARPANMTTQLTGARTSRPSKASTPPGKTRSAFISVLSVFFVISQTTILCVKQDLICIYDTSSYFMMFSIISGSLILFWQCPDLPLQSLRNITSLISSKGTFIFFDCTSKCLYKVCMFWILMTDFSHFGFYRS